MSKIDLFGCRQSVGLLAILIAGLASAQPAPVTALSPTVLQGATGVTIDTGGLGVARLSFAGSSGFLSMELPSSLSVVPCPTGEGSCLAPVDVRVRHTLTGLRQVSILVNSVCVGPTGFGFVSSDNFTCGVGPRLDAQNRVGVSAFVTLQRSVGDPTVSVSIIYNWQVEVSCPTSASPEEPKRGATGSCPVNSIRLDGSLPFNDEPLLGGGSELPAFCGAGQYTLVGSGETVVYLELLDEKDQVVARSNQRRVAKGTAQPWGGGCIDAKQLVLIREVPTPPFPVPPKTPVDVRIGTLRLRAVMEDLTQFRRLALSNPIEYGVTQGIPATSQLVLRPSNPMAAADRPLGPEDRGAAGVELWKGLAEPLPDSRLYSGLSILFKVDSARKGILLVRFLAVDALGKPTRTSLYSKPATIEKGSSEFRVNFDGETYAGTRKLTIEAFGLFEGPQFIPVGESIIVPLESLEIVGAIPDPEAGCRDKSRIENCLVQRTANPIEIQILASNAPPGSRVVRKLDVFRNSPITDFQRKNNVNHAEQTLDIDPSQLGGPGVLIPDSFVTEKDHMDKITVTYYLKSPGRSEANSAQAIVTYDTFVLTRPYQLPTGQKAPIPKGELTNVRTSLPGDFRANTNDVTTKSLGRSLAKDFDKLVRGAAGPDYIGISNTWSFDPPVPRNGSYSATLTLDYLGLALPDDPGFDEARLQMFSIDSAGVVRFYPTALDRNAKTATAEIDSLDPYYSLGVQGPFGQSTVHLPPAGTGYALVNTGSTTSNVNVTTFPPDTEGTTSTPSIASRGQAAGQPPDWVRATASGTALEGASYLSIGNRFAVLASAAPDTFLILPNVELAKDRGTDLHLVNPGTTAARVAISLRTSNGSELGVCKLNLKVRQALVQALESICPAAAPAFSGYAVIGSTQPIVAAGILSLTSSSTGLVAQSMSDANLAATSRFGVVSGDANADGTIFVVNLGTSTANLTLRARTASGSSAGTVNVTLPVNQRYSGSLAEVFNQPLGTIGSVQVDSNVRGIVGELRSSNAAFRPTSLAALPLMAAARTNSVLPYVTTDTTAYIYNPNAAAATVGVTAYASDGSLLRTSAETIPAFGRAAIGSGSTGSLSISAAQPVLVAGVLTSDAGVSTGYLASPSAMASPIGSPGTRPSASAAGVLNAASFKGGAVSPGEIVTIFGSGLGPAALSTLTLSGGRVSTQLAGSRVLFDGVPAPLIYTLTGQASLIVPYSVAGKASTQMIVEYQGRRSDPVTLAVASAAPGLFSANSSGTGPGAILNQDSKVNSPANPAAKGSVVILFGTGEGLGNPAVADGSVNSAVFPKPRDPVTVTIGGLAAEVRYAGAAPGLVAGVLQVNAVVPANAPSGNVPVIVTVGDASSQAGLTVAIAGAASQSPAISVSPTSLSFGSVQSGQTRDLSVRISNTGSAALTVSAIASSAAQFSRVSPATPFNVAAGAFQDVTIRFAPTAAAAFSGTLTIGSNDPARPSTTIALTGTGTAAPTPTPAIVFDPPTMDFGSVASGQTKDLVITVRNNGQATLNVTSIVSSNPRFVLLNAGAFAVGPGSFQTGTVRFSPTAAGPQTGTITFNSNDPTRPTASLTVSGTGTGGGAATNTITFGQTVTGTLSPASGRSVDCTVCYADVYTLTVTTRRTIEIRLNSTAFDAFLSLLDVNNQILSNDDDGGGGLNARIFGTIEPGTYRIEVSTAGQEEGGAYTLIISP